MLKNLVVSTGRPFELEDYKSCDKNVLVISPHPDDDVIGAGGNMVLLAKKGHGVFSLYVSNGSSTIFPGKDVPLIRKKEAVAALRVVKAKGGIFLDFKSSHITGPSNLEVVRGIRMVLNFFRPGAVYVPSPFERHKTHRRVTEYSVRALRQIQDYRPQLMGYHVWGGVWGLPKTSSVDISGVIHLKRKAIRKHKSQLSFKPYDAGIVSRNRFEGVFLETHKPERFEYAETFLDMGQLLANRRLRLKTFSKSIIDQLINQSVQ